MSAPDVQTLLQEVSRLSRALTTLQDRNEIIDLINTYGLLHDRILYKIASPTEAEKAAIDADLKAWDDIFTEDVVAAYSKGTRVGRSNLAAKGVF
jgi:hypothetical protein